MLSLFAESDETVFEHSFEFKFMLQKLRIKEEISFSTENIFCFLQKQAETLELLDMSMHLNFDQACLELILGSMPKLTSLAIGNHRKTDNFVQEYPLNTTVTTLELKPAIVERESIEYEALIRAFVNLKHFKCHMLEDSLFHCLVKHAPALESIGTEYFKVFHLPEGNFFPNIEKFKAKYFHKNVDEPKGESCFEALVKKEMKRQTFTTYCDSSN